MYVVVSEVRACCPAQLTAQYSAFALRLQRELIARRISVSGLLDVDPSLSLMGLVSVGRPPGLSAGEKEGIPGRRSDGQAAGRAGYRETQNHAGPAATDRQYHTKHDCFYD